MPLVPRLENDDHPFALWDKRMCIWRDPDDYMQGFLLRSLIINPFADLKTLISSIQDQGATNDSTDDEFQAIVDVLQFKVEEISVKVSEDGTVTVEAKHEEKQDEHGFISRHFIRTYSLPKSCDLNQVHSKLSFDGVLTISAPKLQDVDERDPLFQGESSKSSSTACASSSMEQSEG